MGRIRIDLHGYSGSSKQHGYHTRKCLELHLAAHFGDLRNILDS